MNGSLASRAAARARHRATSRQRLLLLILRHDTHIANLFTCRFQPPAGLATAGDLAAAIADEFGLAVTSADELLLAMDGFAVLPGSGAGVVRDGDLVKVQRVPGPQAPGKAGTAAGRAAVKGAAATLALAAPPAAAAGGQASRKRKAATPAQHARPAKRPAAAATLAAAVAAPAAAEDSSSEESSSEESSSSDQESSSEEESSDSKSSSSSGLRLGLQGRLSCIWPGFCSCSFQVAKSYRAASHLPPAYKQFIT